MSDTLHHRIAAQREAESRCVGCGRAILTDDTAEPAPGNRVILPGMAGAGTVLAVDGGHVLTDTGAGVMWWRREAVTVAIPAELAR